MGVVHKLKPQIVQYVLEQKRDSPSLSCRALSALVQDAFGTHLSKSSISTILKNEHLSSPVGRRHREAESGKTGPAKKFYLSESKKKEIFSDPSAHPILKDLNQGPDEEECFDGIGNIFLKAAEWESSRRPILEPLMKDICRYQDTEKAGAVAAILGFLKSFQIESLEGLSRYDGKGLWVLNDVKTKISDADIIDIVENFKDRQEFFLKFSLKAPQIFSRVSGFRYILKDGSNFFMDGQNVSIWKNVQKQFSVSLAKATEDLAETSSNVQCKIISAVSPKENRKINETHVIFDFIQAFENVQSKKIQNIELLGENGEILSSFDEIPQIQRSFIAGVFPWEKMFHRFLEVKKIRREGRVVLDFLNREINFKEVVLKIPESRDSLLRGVLLYESFVSVPVLALVTNLGSKEAGAEEIISQYCRRWPDMEKGINLSVLADPSQWAMEGEIGDSPLWERLLGGVPYGRDPVWSAADHLCGLLDMFARKQFFPEKYLNVDFFTMRNRFYSLSGRFCREDRGLCAQLSVPQGFPYYDDLVFASRRVNESGVLNFEGIPLYIKLI